MIGSQSFEKFRDLDALFVDKSLFIEDFINSPSQVDLILRPRRFSKSLNLSMLKSFFRIGTDPDLFKGLVIFERKIGAEESSSSNENVKTFMEEYCGKYPVLHLNLMHVHGSTWMEILRELWSAVQKMAEEHRSVIDLKYPGEDPFDFNKCFSDPPSEDFVKNSFSNLMQTLCEYHKKKVIVLIDEYDTPFNKTHREVFYAKAMEFLGEFLSSALNGNDALFKACIVGVGEVKMDWMSQWKHLTVHSYLNDKYSPYFGITVEEVRQLGVDDEALKHVMKWYGGYYFGDYQVLNPFSLMSWLTRGKECAIFWTGTTSTTYLPEFMKCHEKSIIMDIFTILLEGNPFEIELTSTQVNYSESNWQLKKIMNYLVLTGHLTYLYKAKAVTIPNKEVEHYWENYVMPMLRSKLL